MISSSPNISEQKILISIEDYKWSPQTWQKYVAEQQQEYVDDEIKTQIIQKIKVMPSLIEYSEILELRQEIQEVFEGKKFIIQVGDCAELFSECNEQNLFLKFQFIQNIGIKFQEISQIPATLIGRVCGQFCKPRSSFYETDGTISYRGDLINSFDKNNRQPDPYRLLMAAELQKFSLQYMQSHLKIQSSQRIWTSHECLHLDYESALTRSIRNDYYASSAHFLWIGERTRNSNQAHVHFASGIQNSIGIKISSSIGQEEFYRILADINPLNQTDRIAIITRIGETKIKEFLPQLVDWKKQANLNFIWICDPMHGNTKSFEGVKVLTKFYIHQTRFMDDIKEEISQFFRILEEKGERVSGIHLEATGNDVYECLANQNERKDSIVYQSACDPRLNREQTEDVIQLIAKMVK